MKSESVKILYSGFWDFPLAFTARWAGNLYLFVRDFDDDKDEYEDHYRISLLPHWTDEKIKASWLRIETQATQHLGEVAVKDVSFDATHCREIDAAIFQALASPRELVGAIL